MSAAMLKALAGLRLLGLGPGSRRDEREGTGLTEAFLFIFNILVK